MIAELLSVKELAPLIKVCQTALPERVTEIGMNKEIHFLLYPTNLCIPYQIKRRKIKYCLKHFF